MKILPMFNTNCRVYPVQKQSDVQKLNNANPNKMYMQQVNFAKKEGYSITKTLAGALWSEDLQKIRKYMPSWLKNEKITINLAKGQRKGPLNFWHISDGDKIIGKIDFFNENPETKDVTDIRAIINDITNERFDFSREMKTGKIILLKQSREIDKNGTRCTENIYYEGGKISGIAYNHMDGRFIGSVPEEEVQKLNQKLKHSEALFRLPLFQTGLIDFKKQIQ